MEQSVQVMHWDVFSKEKHKGNPAGVVLNADYLSLEQMQLIAKKWDLTKHHLWLNQT